MKRNDHLMWVIGEEASEVSLCANAVTQRASKAARFGVDEVQPGQQLTNMERLLDEYADLTGALEMLCADLGIEFPPSNFADRIAAKIGKVERYLIYSAQCGTLDPNNT